MVLVYSDGIKSEPVVNAVELVIITVQRHRREPGGVHDSIYGKAKAITCAAAADRRTICGRDTVAYHSSHTDTPSVPIS